MGSVRYAELIVYHVWQRQKKTAAGLPVGGGALQVEIYWSAFVSARHDRSHHFHFLKAQDIQEHYADISNIDLYTTTSL